MSLKALSLAILIIGLTVMTANSAPRSYVVCDKPQATNSHEEVGIHEEIDIFVEVNGQILVNGEKVTVQRLRDYTSRWVKVDGLPFVVSGRRGTPFSKIAHAISILRAAGAKTIACEIPQP